MMYDCKILVFFALIGALMGFVLWAFRLIPAWGIAAAAIAPIAIVFAFVAAFAVALWLRRGH